MTDKYDLDKEEMEILGAFSKGKLKSAKNVGKEIDLLRKAAGNTLRKNERVNIRLSKMVLEQLKTKATEEGLPYQTLISSILHKYVTGRLTIAEFSGRKDK